MRPLRITIEGLRSFRAQVEIDFGDRTQIAVIGETGAGKSSILEAMTYALYGQTSLGARSKQELMNDTSDTMRVVLRFRVSGEEWEVARVDRRTGAGGLRPPQVQLVRYGAAGDAVEKVEQVRQVNARIHALIGLDSDAFLRTVVLPQGRFARLLVEDKPADRGKILRQVWRTHDLETAGRQAGERLQEVTILGARVRDAVARYPDDPRGHLEDLAAAAESATRAAMARTELRDKARGAREALRRSLVALMAADRASASVTPDALVEIATRLEPVSAAQTRIDAEMAELQSQKANLKRELASIPDDEDGPGLSELARILAALDATPGHTRGAVQASEAVTRALKRDGKARARASESRRALAAGVKRLEAHRAAEAPLDGAAQSERERLASAERWHEKCEDLHKQIGASLVARRESRDARAQLGSQLTTARSEERAATQGTERARVTMGTTERSNAAAAAAQGLDAGDECPVCSRDLPEGWDPPQDRGLDEARATLDAAESQLGAARKAVTKLEAQEDANRQRIRDIERELDERRAAMAAALDHLRQAARLRDGIHIAEDGSFPDRAAILASVSQGCREAESQLAEHNRQGERIVGEHGSAQVAFSAAEEALKVGEAELGRTREGARSALDTLRAHITSIPRPFRPQLDLPTDHLLRDDLDLAPVDRARYAARERADILKRREDKRDRLRKGIDAAGAKLRRLDATRKDEVEEPLQAIVRELDGHRDQLAKGLRHLDEADLRESQASADADEPPGATGTSDANVTLPPRVHYPIGPGDLATSIDRIRDAMVATLALAEARRGRANKAAETACGTATELARALDELGEIGGDAHTGAVAPLLDGATDFIPAQANDWALPLDALVGTATTAAEHARYQARDANRARDAFAEILDDVLELQNAALEVADLERALGDLSAALKPGAFLKWLTLRRSRALLVYASRMLAEMTAGRYAFADPGDSEDQQWLIVDNDSGQARSPASLSGGEQFIGSLALALGMVEMMARGGGRLESLFVDEGFGSLDRSNLDSAIEALSTVARQGRMVGVISHVGAVAEQIDDVLSVTRTASGSRVEWLSRAERQEMARADAGSDGASALAGLLE